MPTLGFLFLSFHCIWWLVKRAIMQKEKKKNNNRWKGNMQTWREVHLLLHVKSFSFLCEAATVNAISTSLSEFCYRCYYLMRLIKNKSGIFSVTYSFRRSVLNEPQWTVSKDGKTQNYNTCLFKLCSLVFHKIMIDDQHYCCFAVALFVVLVNIVHPVQEQTHTGYIQTGFVFSKSKC